MLKGKKDKMTLFSSNLYKSEKFTLTVYKSKPNVKVLLLSTKHTGIQVEDNYKRVSETIAFYNKTKFAIMSKSRRYNKILNKIANINEDCSEDTSEEDQYDLGQIEADSESSEYTESGGIKGSLDSEEANFLKVCRNKKRMRIFSSSDSEDERSSIPNTSQNVMGEIKIAIDRTQWIKLKAGGSRGRTPVQKYYVGLCN
ncbi:uncharacterized protein LOC132910340 isoform X2 [Bombus pascuorum]|uniref:uncharacterized protein LOC132910340 isoform X2 n=1 Tax=Bombus pascuorum TaxID=65598 RepID=UPI00298DBD51|nr:uncharacterized protein LOC132910340 isoform X2 [Bombus pascuorum]